MPEFDGKYTKRYDTFMKKWVLERHEGTRIHFVAVYPDTEDGFRLLVKVLDVLNERSFDVV